MSPMATSTSPPAMPTGKPAFTAPCSTPQAGELSFEGTVPLELSWAGPGQDVSNEPVDLRLRAEQLDLSVVRVLARARCGTPPDE